MHRLEASQRTIAKVLGVHHETIARDLDLRGANAPSTARKAKPSAAHEYSSGANAPPAAFQLDGGAVATAAEKKVEPAQMFCEIQLGQLLGPNPGRRRRSPGPASRQTLGNFRAFWSAIGVRRRLPPVLRLAGRARGRGAQRRCEGRIGQLLGEPTLDHDRRKGATSVVTEVAKDDRTDFRILAHAMTGECPLTFDEWRKTGTFRAAEPPPC